MTGGEATDSPLALRSCGGFVPLLAVAAIAMNLSTASGATADEIQTVDIAAPKEFVVFMGIDVFADANNMQLPLPVVGGSESEVVVLGDNGTSVISRDDVVFSAALEPKVSRGGVTIDSLDGNPVHSPLTNPTAIAQEQMISMYNIDADRQEAAQRAIRQAEASAAGANLANSMIPDDAPNKGAAAAAAAAANAQAASITGSMGEVIGNPQFADFLPGPAGENGAFDGFEVTFRVSASERLSDAYGVLQILIRDPSRPELGAQHAFQVFRLPELGPKPKKVIVRRFQLPLGFEVESYEVFVYSDGDELGTNLSRNRVEVTEAEALQFLIFRHTQRNKGASEEARVAQELRPEWPRVELATEWQNILVTLHISAEGTVEETDVEGAISSPLTEELASAVQKVRFLPALAVGEPVPSTGSFALGELFRPPTRNL